MRVRRGPTESHSSRSCPGLVRRHRFAGDSRDASAREEDRTRAGGSVVDLVRDLVLAAGPDLFLRRHRPIRREGAHVELGRVVRRHRALADRPLVIRPVPGESPERTKR